VPLIGSFQNVTGTPGDDWIHGNSALNVLTGGAGNDTLIAGSGDATLVAGTGTDLLLGGTGATTYRFANSGPSSATVVQPLSTQNDTLDFSAQASGVTVSIDAGEANVPQQVNAGLTLTPTNPLRIPNLI